MQGLVSSRGALEADRRAEEHFGYPPLLLMEEAALRLWARAEALVGPGPWAFLAGPGNNGGDALAMARHAHLQGRPGVKVVLVPGRESPSRAFQARTLAALGVPTALWPSAEAEAFLLGCPWWIDGLWRAGLASTLRPEAAASVAALETLRRKAGARTLAIDGPSGLWAGWVPGDPVLEAEVSLAPGPMKDFWFWPALRPFVGRPEAVALSYPSAPDPTASLAETEDLAALLPPVAASDHKGRRGRVALAGGAPGMSGALVLAARSAAAAGAGLVSLFTDPETLALAAVQVPAFQTRTWDPSALAGPYDAWCAGPGWGRSPDRAVLLADLWASDRPLVVDADGLAAWTALGRPPRRAPTVFTPHPGEFLRLGAGEAHPDRAAALAAEIGVTVVLKGAVTWVLGPDGRRAVWDGQEPALGTGGSGDCLAGVTAALLARGLGPFEAALAAVVLHGAAGRDLAASAGWFTADRLPGAVARRARACAGPRPRL